jgi:hypothetical protein
MAMDLYKHCIVDSQTNLVVNLIEYEEIRTGTPPGMNDEYFCVYDPNGTVGAKYEDEKIINPPSPPTPPLPLK